jgi:GTPase Era involved in 16S rRNA processing
MKAPRAIAALQEVVDECRGRVDDALLDPAQAVVNRAGKRLLLSGDTTVVAIAGATGAGKSSLFNALSRTALAETGVRRPTTSQAMSMTFGQTNTAELMTWLSIRRRHSVPGSDLTDLVLIDLPDYDSTVQRHRDEADRLIELVDVILWVVDPQKYADAALHDRYLIPMASHADVMVFVLNQIDRIRPEQIDRIRGDLARVLAGEGITGVDIHAVSAATGQGVDQLRRALREVAARKQAMAARLTADVTAAARTLQEAVGPASLPELPEAAIANLNHALATAAGVDEVADAVEASWRYRNLIATGWPVLSWFRRLRPDPLRRLHLTSRSDARPAEASRAVTSIRAWRSVPAARVDSALRAIADDTVQQLPRDWQQSIARAARSHEAELPDWLDQAIGAADLGLDRRPGWWKAVQALQYALFAVFLVGLVWLGVDFVLDSFLELPKLPAPAVGLLGLPTLLALGGFVLGLLVAGLCRLAATAQARVKRSMTARTLRQAIAAITRDAVVEPVNAELQRHNRAQAALSQLLVPRRAIT